MFSEITAANKSNVCTFAVLGPRQVSQPVSKQHIKTKNKQAGNADIKHCRVNRQEKRIIKLWQILRTRFQLKLGLLEALFDVINVLFNS